MVSSARIRVGVIGVGALGRHHARLYREISNAELVGVFDVDAVAAATIAETFETMSFASIEALADAADALSVAVPAKFHHKVALPLLQAGKHLLLEKPLAATVAEARDLVDLADERGVVLAVGHVERFNPALRAFLSQGAMIRHIEARRESPYPPSRPGVPPRGTDVSVVLDYMVHDIDLVLSLIDAELVGVEASGESLTGFGHDLVFATLHFSDGRFANLVAGRVSQATVRRMRISTNQGIFDVDLGNRMTSLCRGSGGPAVEHVAIPVIEANALRDELADFCRCVSQRQAGAAGGLPSVDGRTGLRAVEVAWRIMNAIG